MRLFLLGSRDLKGISEILDGIVVLRIRYGQALPSRPQPPSRVWTRPCAPTCTVRSIERVMSGRKYYACYCEP